MRPRERGGFFRPDPLFSIRREASRHSRWRRPTAPAQEPTMNNHEPGLTHYMAEAKRFPLLSPEREQELSRAWRDRRDQAALSQLIGSHLRLVIKIARGFLGYRLPLADLIA